MNTPGLYIKTTDSNRLERIWLLAKIEFKLRYYENKLGLLWALIKPLSNLVIYFVAFKIIMRNSIEDYAIYLFTGLIIWQFFGESSGGLTNILKTKKYLYEYTNMSKLEIYLASLISVSLGLFFNLVVLFVILIINGNELGINLLYFPLLFLVLFIFCFGMALILSNLFLVAKDINQIWPLLMQFLMWLSPLFLSFEALQKNIPFIGYINPMFGIIANFRNIIMYNQPPDITLLIINIFHAVLAIILGVFLLNKIGKKASELL